MISTTKRIVFVNQATGYLTIDIINAFVPHFDEVAVIYGDIRVQDIPLNPKVKKSKVAEKSRKNNLSRFVKWSFASIQIFFLLITRYRKFEIFYFSVPPFAYLSSLMLKRKFSILMWDVYPDALKIADIKESNFIYRIWVSINKRLLPRAQRIYTIGEGLKELISQYINCDKIKVIPLWSGLSNISEIPKAQNPFIKQYHLQNKFIVQYSGNIGPSHNIESLVEAAKLMTKEDDILFLIIGRGTKFDVTKQLVSEAGFTNFLFLPFQPDDMIKYTLAAADISVVLIEDKIAQVSIPSKVYNIMAVGSPILSISDAKSEINRLLKKYGNGKNFSNESPVAIAQFIIEMKISPAKLMEYKRNSVSASKDFTIENAKRFVKDYLEIK